MPPHVHGVEQDLRIRGVLLLPGPFSRSSKGCACDVQIDEDALPEKLHTRVPAASTPLERDVDGGCRLGIEPLITSLRHYHAEAAHRGDTEPKPPGRPME